MENIISPNEPMEQGTKVEWNPMVGWMATGKVCGIASNGVPIAGLSYIIELDDEYKGKMPSYPYSHAVAFEVHLKKI